MNDESRPEGRPDASGLADDSKFVVLFTDEEILSIGEHLPDTRLMIMDGEAPSNILQKMQAVGRLFLTEWGNPFTDDHPELNSLFTRMVPSPHRAGVDTEAEGIPRKSRVADGETFIFDGPTEIEPVWGQGDDVLWARGEPLMLFAPTGLGKTTLAVQVLGGLLGLTDEVLGLPVTPTANRVVYFAQDRPTQIRRLLLRYFTNLGLDEDTVRDVLAEKLVIWSGPLPKPLNVDPDQLFSIAQQLDATAIIIDSLKDAASGLTSDEDGARINRAFQLCSAVRIDVLVTHHARKTAAGDTSTAMTIDKVYGSALITAGMGSVIGLAGKPGDPVVDLQHLKTPMGEVGPFRIIHDDATGQSRIDRGFDLIAYLRNRGERGATAMDVARAWFEKNDPTRAQQMKALRRVRQTAHVEEISGSRGGAGGSESARFRLAELNHTSNHTP